MSKLSKDGFDFSFKLKINLNSLSDNKETSFINYHENEITKVLDKNNNFKAALNKYNNVKNFLQKKIKSTNKLNNESEIFYENEEIKTISNNIIDFQEFNQYYKIHFKNKKEYKLCKKGLLLEKRYGNKNEIDLFFVTTINEIIEHFKEMKKYEYKIYAINKEENKIQRINSYIDIINYSLFSNNDFQVFLIRYQSKIPQLTNRDILYKNIYSKNIVNENQYLINPKEITKNYFYYIKINTEFQENYKFIYNDKRKKIIEKLSNFIEGFSHKNVMIFSAPKGAGKTSSLIFLSSIYYLRIFYLNLDSFKNNEIECKLKDLLLQTNKLFGNIDSKFFKKYKLAIEKYIKENYKNSIGIKFLYQIIKYFKDYVTEYDDGKVYCFIIDQYSLNIIKNKEKEQDESHSQLMKIIHLIYKVYSIKLIICPTLNNYFIKKQFSLLFENKLEFDSIILYYNQEFLSREDISKYILSEENEENTKFYEELDGSPIHFYELKNINSIKEYKTILQNNIKENIKEYFHNDTIKNTIDILDLLDLVRGEKIISSTTLLKYLKELPLKYLKIEKYKIKYEEIMNLDFNTFKEIKKYLLSLFNEDNYKNDLFFKENFEIEENNTSHNFEIFEEIDESKRNLFGNYYKDYIKNLKINDKKYISSINLNVDEIYIYKLKFNSLLFENEIYKEIFNSCKSFYSLINKIMNKGFIGGFFEVLVIYKIKANKEILGFKFNDIISIQTLVPNSFSIKYYSIKRKKYNKFTKLNIELKHKRNLLNDNILLFQILFNGKYYDIAILVKSGTYKHFYLIVFQISIKKDTDKRFIKLEHELILSAVKKNIENQYDLIIDKAFFFYIFCKFENKDIDLNSINFCKNNGICYIIYNINTEQFEYFHESINDALITSTFPSHNFISLFRLPKKEKKLTKYLLNIDYTKDFSSFNSKYMPYINAIFKNKYLNESITINQFQSLDIKNNLGGLKIIEFSILNNFTTEFCFFIARKYNKKDNDYKTFVLFLGDAYIFDDISLKFEVFNNFIFGNNLEECLLCYSNFPLEIKY